MMKCSRYEIISIFWMWYTHTTYKSDLAESCKIHFEKSSQEKKKKPSSWLNYYVLNPPSPEWRLSHYEFTTISFVLLIILLYPALSYGGKGMMVVVIIKSQKHWLFSVFFESNKQLLQQLFLRGQCFPGWTKIEYNIIPP